MKIDDVKVGQLLGATFPYHPTEVGQLLGATFPYHPTEPTKKYGYRVLKIENGCVVRAQDVKTGEIERFGFFNHELPNWHIVEDVP